MSPDFTLGLDVGYGVGLRNINKGAFYLSPKVQYAVTNPLDVVLRYKGPMDRGNNFEQIFIDLEVEL